MLTREQFLKSVQPRTGSVEVPDLGLVKVREVLAGEVIELANKFGTQHGDLPMLIYGVLNDDGTTMFTEADMPTILTMPYSMVAPILSLIKELSHLDKAAPKAIAVSS